jgi:putative endonuclease
MANLRNVGDIHEEAVCKALVDNGYHIIERNYRVRQGEIDIIANDKEYLVFIEVKYRKGDISGDGFDAVDYKKQRQISKVALYYMSSHKISDSQAIRFDVASVSDKGINIIKNAFDFQYMT